MPETPGIARVIAIANQKGGVGKSTTAVSLGAALADLGYRVLVVDLDPQGNASTGMGIRHEARGVTVYDVVVAESPLDEAIVPTAVDRLHAVPSTIDLAGAEIELVSQLSRETRLKKAIAPVREGVYDFILLDCPPSLGLLTINALTAAEELIVPIQCEYYALEGLGQLLRNVSLVQRNINQGLCLSGIVMTMFDPRTKLSEQVVEEVKRYFGELVYDVIIPRTVRLSEAPGYGQPITVYDPRSKGADSYRRLASEVAQRPPPEEPMPAFDDLPAVVLPALDDTITPSEADEASLEALSTLTVHEVMEHVQAEGEGGASGTPEPADGEDPSLSTGEPIVDGESGADAGALRTGGEEAGSAGPVIEPPDSGAPPEDASAARPRPQPPDDPPRPAPEPASPVGPADTGELEVGFEIDLPLGEDEFWGEDEEPPIGADPTPERPGTSRDHRVVVIDEDAEPDAPRPDPGRQGPGARDQTPPRSGVAKIGATLEEDEAPKRRWRLFRKGGA